MGTVDRADGERTKEGGSLLGDPSNDERMQWSGQLLRGRSTGSREHHCSVAVR